MILHKFLKLIFNFLIWIFSVLLAIAYLITIEDIGFLNALCFSLTLFIIFFTFANYGKSKVYNQKENIKFRKTIFYTIDDINNIENKKIIKNNINFLNECKTKFIFNKICKKNNKIEIENEMITYKEFVDYAKENPRKIDKIIRTNKIKVDKRFNGELYERYIYDCSTVHNIYKKEINEFSLIVSIVSLIPSINIFEELSKNNQSLVLGFLLVFFVISIILNKVIQRIFLWQIKREQQIVSQIIEFLNNQEVK